ncbi:MAG TPA: sigma-54 dependent transcriptional regulator, partial [Kofleriaceae bacterium]|nr:sigma-54 dependent transcriptional regulator [Kofleriaceae bacterium]
DISAPIRAVGRVAWTSRVHDGGRLGFGVEFRELSQRGRTHLARFLAEHKPRVVAAFASASERTLVEDCLRELDLVFVDTRKQLTPDLLCNSATVIVFADELAHVTSLLDELLCADAMLPIELPLASITVVTRVASELPLPQVSSERVYEVLRPPLDASTLVSAVERSCERWALKFELRWASLQLEGTAVRPRPAATPEPAAHSGHIIRVSAQMQRTYDLIQTVAIHDVPVLLYGETGTGKELAAREIHALSKRAHTPFVAQDCGALIESLLESELFGHVRGAFTGAISDHPGLFQIADGGTIFLDEIQNTSPALQAKLLRVIEEGEVRPVGGTKPRRVDVRLVAACNVDLEAAVSAQRFRSDFYYRLNRFPIRLPALRDHTDDIVPLMRYFMSTICVQLGRDVPRIEPRAERALVAYRWPGNIRELKNTIERSLLLTKPGEPLRWDTLPDAVRGNPAPRARGDVRGLEAQLADVERELISKALERHNGVVRRAAHDLGVNAVTLARKMKKLGLGES